MEITPLLTVNEFCEAVGISRSTWHKLKRQGSTPPIIMIGTVQRIRKDMAEAWLTENETKGSTVH